MRKELTAIGALSALIAFAAGAVLCMQIATLGAAADVPLAGPVLWGVEIAVFGAVIYVWRPRVSFAGWVAGIVGLVVVRAALSSSAGMALAMAQDRLDVGGAVAEVSSLVPRTCAALFALMVCYPMRAFLPVRPRRQQSRGYANSPAARASDGRGDEGDRGLLIVTVKDRHSAPAERFAPEPVAHAPAILTSSAPVDGEINLPLETVLTLIPEELVTDRALAAGEGETMRIPLEIIHPQLKEAQVVFTVAELRAWFPPTVRKALVQANESNLEIENGLVSLPLALIVPQLPSEALALPSPPLPAWAANADPEARVVFATS